MKERNKIFLLFSAGAIFRIFLYLIFAKNLVVGSDQMRNITLARQFASGDYAGVLDAYWTPLYPFLIGVVSLFSDSLTLPSIIVSVIAGALAVPLTYCIVKEFFGEREALIAGAIAVFYPHLLNSFFALGTENVYLLWMNAALLCGWRGLKSGRALCFGAAGLFFGLAYLTRPEAFAYPFFFALIALFVNRGDRQIFTRNAFAAIGAMMLAFFICAAPYLFYLHEATGTWTISDKTKINTVAAELDDEEDVNNARAANPTESENVRSVRILLDRVNYNVKTVHQIFPIFIPPFFLMLVALGLFRRAWDRERLQRESFLVLFCVITIVGYSLSVVQLRYFYFLLPIFFGWTARGILEAEDWLRKTLVHIGAKDLAVSFSSEKLLSLTLLFICFYTLPLNFFMRSTQKDRQINAYEERDAGLWIKQHSEIKNPRVFSIGLRPAFYAEGEQIRSDAQKVGELLADIRKAQPDFIVSGDRALTRHPQIKNLDRTLAAAPDLECVYQNIDPSGFQISIYRFKSR